ncbi:MAG: hypothetical protein LBB88_01975 [Planctomycetaceae bacterium]|jgi:hypothetical protein|nr:hypothetical protein [Planctomycetaceae bacterium]
MSTSKIEEVLGFNSTRTNDSDSLTRRFYVTSDSPETANVDFHDYAKNLTIPDNFELGNIELDEEKNANGLYFGTITFVSLNPKIKNQLDDDLFELYGEKLSTGRKAASHERRFRIKADDTKSAKIKLENYIRNNNSTSGRLHISEISVDESSNGDGFFSGVVTYNNPDHKGDFDKIDGLIPAYGSRWSEQYDNGIHTSSVAEDVFELRGYPDSFSALQALKSAFPNPYIKEINIEEDSGGADKTYIGRIRRTEELPELDLENKRSISFEVSGSQTKMTHSLLTRGSWASGNNSPRDYGGLIGVTDDGVEGVDIDTAVSTFSETVYFYPWFLTSSYVAFLARAYGHVNMTPFRGFDIGEVRFLGANGSYRYGDTAVELTFKFAVSPNAMNIQIGEIVIPFKYGWDYLWIRWADVKRNNVSVKTPIEAYVEQVYPGLNFYLLGIG